MASGFVKTLKKVSRSPSFLIKGLKVWGEFWVWASSFIFFLLGVSDRLSWLELLFRGFHLGFRWVSTSLALWQHLLGSVMGALGAGAVGDVLVEVLGVRGTQAVGESY